MGYDKALIAGKLRRWEIYLKQYRLPAWDEIPDFGLYMEQVIMLLQKHLDYLPPELKEEQIITAAAINNYVRKGIMPKPEKKKYYRIHIAYLILICTLKQTLSITTLQKLIPNGLSEEEVRDIYNSHVRRHREAASYFIEQVRMVAGGVLDHADQSEFSTDDPAELIATTAFIGGFCRLLAQKLLLLEGKTLADGGSIEKPV